MAAARHSDVSPPTKGPGDRIISAVAFLTAGCADEQGCCDELTLKRAHTGPRREKGGRSAVWDKRESGIKMWQTSIFSAFRDRGRGRGRARRQTLPLVVSAGSEISRSSLLSQTSPRAGTAS